MILINFGKKIFMFAGRRRRINEWYHPL